MRKDLGCSPLSASIRGYIPGMKNPFPSRRLRVTVLTAGLVFSLAACGANGNPTPTHQPAQTPTTGNPPAGPGGVGS